MFTRYQPRPLSFLGLEPVAGHRLKAYSIRHADRPFDSGRFAGVWELAAAALPPPDEAAGSRPGKMGRAIRWNPFTDWNHTMEVMDRIRVRGMKVTLQDNAAGMFLRIHKKRHTNWFPVATSNCFYHPDDRANGEPTRQRAICVAALLACTESHKTA
jgi:hypothetical protein